MHAIVEFSHRQRLVIRGIERGLTYQQIAAENGLGLETVRTYVAQIRKKLGTTKAGIAAWAARNPGD